MAIRLKKINVWLLCNTSVKGFELQQIRSKLDSKWILFDI